MRTHMSGRLVAAALAVIALPASLAACGGSDKSSSSTSGAAAATTSTSSGGGKLIQLDAANKGKKVKIGSKNFTESIILGYIYGEALKKAGYSVSYDLNLGNEQVATRALKTKEIDAYPEYTGTALTSLLGVKPKDVPHDESAAYEQAKRLYESKYGFTALPQTPFTDSQALGMTAATAKKLGNPTKISDLKGKSQNLTIAGSTECFKRTDCALGFKTVYGLTFKKEIPIDVAQRHEVILKGKADLTVPFTTDGQIAANKEVVLKDDKHLFPPYNVTFVVRDPVFKSAGPDFEKVVANVQTGLTTPVMSELNSRVDLDKQQPLAVAEEYLKATGYVK
jgi:glycine betaine/choline ABC-type transport system substrate-binding protein